MARKTKEMAEITRKEILKAALEIFSEKNYSSVTIVEIAKKANLTKGAVYWHFKNKKDILVHLLNGLFAINSHTIIEIFEKPVSVSEMRFCFKEALLKPLTDKKYRRMHKFISQRESWPETVQKQADNLIKDNMNIEKKKLEAFLIKAKENKKINKDVDPSAVATLITYVFYGLFLLQVAGVLPGDFVDNTDFMFDSISRELEYRG